MSSPRRDPDATTSYLPSSWNIFRDVRASGQSCISSRKIRVLSGSNSTSGWNALNPRMSESTSRLPVSKTLRMSPSVARLV